MVDSCQERLRASEKEIIKSLTLINKFTVSTLRESPFETYQNVADFHENCFQQFLRDRKDTRVDNNLVDMSQRLLQSVKDQLAYINDLKTQLDREKKLNFNYRLGYTTDFYVFLSTFLRIACSNYQSSSKEGKLLKKLPSEKPAIKQITLYTNW